MSNRVGRKAIGKARRPLALTACLVIAAAASCAPTHEATAQGVSKADGAAAAATVDDNALKRRVESLEEQLVDMQVVVGTLESLAKAGGASASPALRTPVTGAADNTRIEALEAQLRELSAQVQQLTAQVHATGLPARSEMAGSALATQASAEQPTPSFGSTTVTRNTDPIGGLIAGTQPPSQVESSQMPTVAPTAEAGELGATPTPVATSALPPNIDTGDPKTLYEAAYGYLLQRDYGAAQVAFDEFLKKYPGDSLASNAQYWLGETYFVRGQYKSAAGAFLKGYQSYGSGAKAPDSLLKLAMSLDRLGQKDAACSSFSELNAKFPSAPQSVKARAQSERQRVGCP